MELLIYSYIKTLLLPRFLGPGLKVAPGSPKPLGVQKSLCGNKDQGFHLFGELVLGKIHTKIPYSSNMYSPWKQHGSRVHHLFGIQNMVFQEGMPCTSMLVPGSIYRLPPK